MNQKRQQVKQPRPPQGQPVNYAPKPPNNLNQNRVPGNKQSRLKTWHKVLIGTVGVLLLFAIIGSCSQKDEKETTPQQQNEATTPRSTEQTESPVQESSPEQEITPGQSNALKAAKNYLNVMAFSHSGLIAQLEYEKYSTEDATYAADNCGADWSEQAAKAAQNYLDIMAFSRDGLIDQLEYEGYTYDQAVYGVDAVGL